MIILGINCYTHDAAATLIVDGKVIASIEEERLNREKHSSKFPRLAIGKCLEIGRISITDVTHFAYYFKPDLEFFGNLLTVVRHLPASLNLFRAPSGGDGLKFYSRIRLQYALGERLKQEFAMPSAPRIHYIEHHMAHAASAFYVSPFEKAAILTWDGRGERTTTLMAQGDGTRIRKIQETFVPHSLGHLYAAVTDYLGFRAFLDEWKVMGMSAYGKDTILGEFKKILRLKDGGRFELDLGYFHFHTHGQVKWVSAQFSEIFGPRRLHGEPIEQKHFDLAFALQKTVEEAGVHVAQGLYEKTKLPALCMAGGVALNVLLNQKIMLESAFQEFFIQPIASDSGTSLGAALYLHHQILNGKTRFEFDSVNLGPEFSNQEIENLLKSRQIRYKKSDCIEKEVAEHIFEGKIVGWFQGRMEAGPRALGNRSIVVNPTDAKMKDRLNERVKRRESFRPFAPSVLEERVHDYFAMPKNQLSPYMIVSGDVRPEMQSKIPAVTHADQTARVHTVSRKTNPRYWNLISEFEKLSGVPVLLNTSFNENEPIVCTPEDALNCFLRTEFDTLGIGDFLVTK